MERMKGRRRQMRRCEYSLVFVDDENKSLTDILCSERCFIDH